MHAATGLKDRLNKPEESVSTSPLDVTLVEQGTPTTLSAGQPVTVNVLVNGEDDGHTERIALWLNLSPIRARKQPGLSALMTGSPNQG